MGIRQWGEGLGGLPGLTFQGAWNAATNTPPLASGVGNKGDYYVVGTGGATNLDGITDWVALDWATFNGTIWQKVDNTEPAGANLWAQTAGVLHPLTATDDLAVGVLADVADAGEVRLESIAAINWRNNAGDGNILGLQKDSSDRLLLGGIAGTANVEVSASNSLTIRGSTILFETVGTGTAMFLGAAQIQSFRPVFEFVAGVVSPIIRQLVDTAATAGDTLTSHAQDLTTAAGAKVAGDYFSRGGDCADGDVSNTGGGWGARPGAGATANGELVLRDAIDDPRLTVGDLVTIEQPDASGAVPALVIDQADVSEEMLEFISTIGVGNAIEAVGAKALTTTHFIKVTLPGALTRYIPVGTIA